MARQSGDLAACAARMRRMATLTESFGKRRQGRQVDIV